MTFYKLNYTTGWQHYTRTFKTEEDAKQYLKNKTNASIWDIKKIELEGPQAEETLYYLEDRKVTIGY